MTILKLTVGLVGLVIAATGTVVGLHLLPETDHSVLTVAAGGTTPTTPHYRATSVPASFVAQPESTSAVPGTDPVVTVVTQRYLSTDQSNRPRGLLWVDVEQNGETVTLSTEAARYPRATDYATHGKPAVWVRTTPDGGGGLSMIEWNPQPTVRVVVGARGAVSDAQLTAFVDGLVLS